MDEWRESTAAYALGVLPAEERVQLEAHLLVCADCAAEARSLSDVTAMLAYAAPPARIDASLRDRVVQAVASNAAGADPTTFENRSVRRMARGPVRPWPWLLAAASLFLAVGLGVYSVQLRRAAADARTVVVVLAASDLVRVDLAGQVVAPQASARAFWSHARGLVFTASNLPPLPSGRIYQLWIISGQTPVGAGLLKPAVDGTVHAVFATPAGLARAAAMAVTIEPAGGVPAPTGDKFLVGLVN